MRADRLLSILLLLDDHRRLTAADLAERLEVSPRTIYRDLDALSAAGVPVYAERGHGGACCLPSGYRVQLNGLSAVEAQALGLSVPTRVLRDMGLTQPADAAARKLMHALPGELRDQAEVSRSRILVDTAGWADRLDESVEHLGELQAAVWQEQRLAMTYGRADGAQIERVVDPLGLVAKGNTWYLVAAVAGQLRVYRASRVLSVRRLAERASRPPGFDLAAFWRESTAAYRAQLPRYTCRIRVAPEAVDAIRGARRVRFDGEAANADGTVDLTLTFGADFEARDFALTRGLVVEVLEPAQLRDDVARTAAKVAARYDV